MDQTPQNPYRAPETNPPPKSKGSAYLASIKSSEIKKLRNHSHTLRAIAILACLAAIAFIVVYFRADPAIYYESFGLIIGIRIFILILVAINLAGAVTFFARKVWSKPIGIVYCCLLILSLKLIPLIIGVFGIIALCNSKRLLGQNRITHTEINKEYKIRKQEGRI